MKFMEDPDIRWTQRLQNYRKALSQLEKAVLLSRERDLSYLEIQGLIKAFEFTHELAWNVIKDYMEYQGDTSIKGSRDAARSAFRIGLISDGEGWMDMIQSRNKTTHTYNESTAEEIADNIIGRYFDLFKAFETKMESIRSEEQSSFFK